MSTQNLTEAFAVVGKLSREEKLQLIEHVAHELQRDSQPSPALLWKDARGLGKEIWEGVDIDNYIDDLRDEWDH